MRKLIVGGILVVATVLDAKHHNKSKRELILNNWCIGSSIVINHSLPFLGIKW